MSWKLMRFRDFLKRSKIPIEIQDNELYKRVTIKIKHNGVSLRDEEIGKQIGTKKQFILKAGQFILSKIDARYGAFGIAPEEVDEAIITGNFWAYDVDFSLVNIDWFNQFTNSQDFYDLCERASSGITHRKYLNENFFLDNEIYLPSPEEQLQIIEEFKTNRESINILSTELTHQLDLVKQLRQAFLREAMQGKLVPQDPTDEPASVLLEKIQAEKERLIKDKKIKKQKPLPPISEKEIPFTVPENWVWCRLGEIFNFIDYRGKTPTRTKEGVRLISAKNIRFGFIDNNPVEFIAENQYSKWMVRGFPRNGDILFVTEGHTMGFVAQINLDFKYVLAQRTICLQPHTYDYSNCTFYFLMSPDFQHTIQLNATGAAATGIKSAKLKEMLIPMPPLSEQQRIFAKLDELMAYCDELEVSIKESQQQNELLLQQVLREALEPKEKEVKG